MAKSPERAVIGSYTSADHKQAFEIYYQHRTYSAIISSMNITQQTLVAWKSPTCRCKWGCPWHDWDKLIAEREAVAQAKIALIENGNYDPVDHDKAVRGALENAPNPRKHAALTVIKSDLEILNHWEFVYNKIFCNLTGLALEHQNVRTDSSDLDSLLSTASTQDLYRQGLNCETAGEAVRLLALVRDKIDAIKVRMGVNLEAKPEEQEAAKQIKPLSLQDLRDIKERLKNEDPERLALMAAMIQRQETHG